MSVTVGLSLGSTKSGISDLRAQFKAGGQDVGGPIADGFYEVGGGNYYWECAAIADGWQGAIVFYRASAPTVTLAVAAINPTGGGTGDISSETTIIHTR